MISKTQTQEKEEIFVENFNYLNSNTSKMMMAYVELKKQYLDTIIFYRLGDFYEMFFNDAKEMSRVLELTLTAKSCGGDQKTHMCGVPAKAVDIYLTKAVEAGYKVAICEQVGDPKDYKATEVMKREVVRIVTPGTIMESEALNGKKNNYVMAGMLYKGSFGLSWVDITTGEFYCTEVNGLENSQNVIDIFTMVQPSEIIVNHEFFQFFNDVDLNKINLPSLEEYEEEFFDFINAELTLKKQLNTNSLKPFGCENLKHAISSSGALLCYIKETQKRDLMHINNIKVYSPKTNMYLDYQTRHNLELTKSTRDGSKKGSLLWLLDETQTSMGGRMLRKFVDSPLFNKRDIELRLNAVEELKNNLIKRDAIKETLKEIYDIERLSGKLAYGSLNPKECYNLGQSLSKVPVLRDLLETFKAEQVVKIRENLTDLEEVANLIISAIDKEAGPVQKDGGFIKEGFNEELDELKNIKDNSTTILNQLEAKEKEITGIKTLKLGYNRVFGYFWEISNSFKDMVPFRFVRKQTLTTGERFITEELKELEDKILGAEEKAIKLEQDLFNNLKEVLKDFVPKMQKCAVSIALLDAFVSLASVAAKNNYCKPKIISEGELNIVEGRHPIVEVISNAPFIANDCSLNNTDCKTMVITGPNMAGKSTYMRQTAIICLMAHMGSFVPAKECTMPLTDRIFTRIGASDDLAYGQSTFMVEMSEVSAILKNATDKSLILLDEVGRGTATFDGLSIAWSVMEYISNHLNSKTLFSTHYHELTELEGVLNGVKNYRVQVKEYNNSIVFLRKIVRGGANRSFGIEVASLAGMPQEVLDRARQILHSLEESDINNNSKLTLTNNTKQMSAEEIEQTVKTKANNAEICNMLKELNMNKLSPMEAFMILNDLSQKAKQ